MKPIALALLLSTGAGAAAHRPAAPAQKTISRAPLRVMMVAAEAVPFVKTGGLADVADDVTRGLAARGHDVTLVLPRYRALDLGGLEFSPAGRVAVPIADRVETAELRVARREGVRVILLDAKALYDRPGGPYDDKRDGYAYSAYDAGGAEDAAERFGFLARGAVAADRALGLRTQVYHAQDWHAALLPAYARGVPTVLTIHNLRFQGAFSPETAGKLGLRASPEFLHHGRLNFLKAGIALADAVTTVSPTYAREITTDPRFAEGLLEALQARPGGVRGILNGIDRALWDPSRDPTLARNYDALDSGRGKAENKRAFQAKLGLHERPEAPLFAVASRFSDQKGIDRVLESSLDILREGGQLALMGSGDPGLEAAVDELAASFPGAVARHPFDAVAVRPLFAAADWLLMPSNFEPCGLSQQMAQAYGALPIVAPTGGLLDTVRDMRYHPDGDGVVMGGFGSMALSRAIHFAVKAQRDPARIAAARRAAMVKDSSWGPSLDRYEELLYELAASAAARP